jgi:hypothetical protein
MLVLNDPPSRNPFSYSPSIVPRANPTAEGTEGTTATADATAKSASELVAARAEIEALHRFGRVQYLMPATSYAPCRPCETGLNN